MNKELFAALDSLEKEKGISKEILFEALEVALISAYKRNFQSAPAVRVSIDRDTGEIKVFSQLRVVENVESEQQEVSLYEARVYDPRCQIEDIVEMEVTPREFGRIAAQTAKQVVIQRIREAERELIYENFVDRTEEIITGLVRRFEQRNVIIDLGRTEAVLPVDEQIPHERYRQGERVKTYIVDVKKTTKGPQIIVSRTHTGFLKRLFEMEVPEIYEGIVEIKAAAREAGYRSKLAVFSNNKDIDPVGACVGPKGSRVQAISNELKGEKIDIIKWSAESEEYIANALSPAKVSSVILNSDQKMATVVVPDTQLSLAIGKEGQNARLSAKITGWKIDISSETQFTEKSLSAIGLADPDADNVEKHTEENENVSVVVEPAESAEPEEVGAEAETVITENVEEVVEKEVKPKKKTVKAKSVKKEKKRKTKTDPDEEAVEEFDTDD
ncbi:MAG: transcription termination/antitermination protein NusA [Firmicutes bacterium]|nr:transcription termination/antitermination protein NusA [Bacillota bacterium]